MGNDQNIKLLTRPNGLTEIISTFGDINPYIKTSADGQMNIDPGFERKYITSINLPYPLRLAWDHQKEISTIKCHTLLEEYFKAIFREIIQKIFVARPSISADAMLFAPKETVSTFPLTPGASL